MTDRAAELAEFLHHHSRGLAAEEIHRIVTERWPGITEDEIARAVDIARELLEAEAAEHFAKADAVDAEAARRREARDEP